MPGGTTDTRIVQMQFDNKEFEKNISTSEKSLEKFKEALDFEAAEKSLAGFEDATRKLTFDKMAENLQRLTDKFTGLGTASEYIISQIRHGLESAAASAQRFVNSLTLEQVNAGFDKFGQTNKQIQTIMAATGKSEADVQKVLERLNAYTDQTSYNFVDMAANIGKFTSVGIDLESAEKQMEGIANWAARSGGGIQEASRAMYNLSQAMGVGALTLMDWKSIQNAGMATKEFKEQLIQAGVEAGNLEVKTRKAADGSTETYYLTAKKFGKQEEVNFQNLSNTLQKRWADTTVMQKAFLTYYYDDLYYEGTSTAVEITDEQKKIFEDAFKDNANIDVKEWKSLESQKLATDEIKQAAMDAAVEQKNLVKETTKDGKTIYKTADKYGKQIEVTLDTFENSLKTGWLDKGVAKNVWAFDNLAKAAYESAQKCMTFTDVLGAWKDMLSTGWMHTYQNIFGNLAQSMELFSNICNKVSDSLAEFMDFRNEILSLWGEGGGRDTLWSLVVGEVTDEDGKAIAYEGAYGMLDVLNDIGTMLKDGFWNMMKLFAPSTVLYNWDDEMERNGWLASSLDGIIKKVKDFVASIKDFFNETGKGSDKSRWEQIQDVVNAVFATFVMAYTVMRDISNFITELLDENHLGPSIESILRLLSALGLGIYDLADSAEDGNGLKLLFDDLLVSLKPLIDGINQLVEAISSSLIEIIKSGEESGTFAGIWQTIIDIISLLGRVIAKVSGPVLKFVSEFLNIVVDLFSGEIDGEKLKALGSRLENAITTLIDDLFGLIPGIGDKIQGFLAYIFGFTEEYLGEETDESSRTILGVAKIWLRKIFGGVANLFDNIKKDADQFNLFTWVKDMLGIGNLGKFLRDMSGIVKGTNLYGIIMTFLGGYALFKLVGVLRNGKSLLQNMRGFFQGMQDTMKDGLKLKFGDQLESTGDKVLKIAGGIALIAASIAVLGSLNTGSLIKGFVALGLTMTALAGFIWLMEKHIAKDFKSTIATGAVLAGLAAAVMAMTIGIGLLIVMLTPLANMKPEQLTQMLTGLFGVVTILALFCTYTNKNLKIKGVGSIAALAFAIGMLIFALLPLANLDIESLFKMGGALIGILYVLSEFSSKAGSLKIDGGKSLIPLAASIGILIFALLGLKDLNAEQLTKMGVSLLVILNVLASFTKHVAFIKGAGMGQLLLVAASIWLLMEALKPLAAYEWEDLGKIGAGLAVTMLILGMFINGTQSMRGTGMANMVMVAGAIWILMQALMPLAKVKWPDLAKIGAGLLVVAGIVTAMTHLMGDMNILQGTSIAIMLIGFSAVLLTFGFAMGSLTNVSWDKIVVACTGIIGVLMMFGLVQKYLLQGSDLFDALHTLILMVALSAVMIAFSIAMNEIKNVDNDKILVFSLGLAALITAIGVALKLTSGLNLAAGIKGILIISAALAAFMAVFALVGKLVSDTIGSALVKLAANLKLFSGMMSDFGTRMNSVDEGSVKKAERVFDMITHMLTNVGSYVASAVSSSALTTVASHLALTSGLMIDFSNRMGNVSEANVQRAQKVVKEIRTMLDGMEGFEAYTSRVSAFSTILYDLGTGVEIFNTHTGNVGDLSDNSALQLIKDLSACAGDLDTIANMKIDNLTASMTGLGGAMMLYAKGAEEVTGIEASAEGSPDVASAVKILRDISTSLTENGGFTIPENMPDEQALGLFGAQLAALAGALIQFEEAGSTLGEGTDKALECLDFFKKLKEKLVEIDIAHSLTTAITSFVTGEDAVTVDEMTTFGKNIEQLGLSMKAFAVSTTVFDEATGEMKPIDYSKATEALESMAGLSEKLPTIGGIKTWWEGNKQSLTDFAADLEALGQGLKDFSMKVTGQSEDSFKGLQAEVVDSGKTAASDIVDKAIELITKLTEAQGKLKPVGGFKSIWTGTPPSLSDLGGELEVLGTGLNDFSSKINGTEEGSAPFDPEQAKGAIQIVDDIISVMEAVATKLPTVGGLAKIFETMATGRTANLSDVSSELETLGTSLGGFATAVTGKFSNADEMITAIGVVDHVVGLMANLASRTETYAGSGSLSYYIKDLNDFLKGLTSLENPDGTQKEMTAIDAMVSMMGSISTAMDQAGNIDSTNLDVFSTFADSLTNIASLDLSTIEAQFQNVGANIASGTKIGIENGRSGVINAAVKMATDAYEAAKAALDIHSPSRVFMSLGGFVSEGMAIGITKSADEAATASEDMATNLVDSSQGVLAQLSNLLSQDIDSNPTISPVLDLTNVTSGIGAMDGMMNRSYQLALDTSQAAADAARYIPAPRIEADAENQNESSSLDDVIARMDVLTEAMAGMGDKILKMKLVLDSGTVAGGVTDDVDSNIGRRMFYAGRGN